MTQERALYQNFGWTAYDITSMPAIKVTKWLQMLAAEEKKQSDKQERAQRRAKASGGR